MTWIAQYARYFDRDQEDCESLQEAINYLYWGEEAGVLRGLAIVGPDGNEVTATWDEPVADD